MAVMVGDMFAVALSLDLAALISHYHISHAPHEQQYDANLPPTDLLPHRRRQPPRDRGLDTV